jgi:hypothetical protein
MSGSAAFTADDDHVRTPLLGRREDLGRRVADARRLAT